jgi:hypothetical protein
MLGDGVGRIADARVPGNSEGTGMRSEIDRFRMKDCTLREGLDIVLIAQAPISKTRWSCVGDGGGLKKLHKTNGVSPNQIEIILTNFS